MVFRWGTEGVIVANSNMLSEWRGMVSDNVINRPERVHEETRVRVELGRRKTACRTWLFTLATSGCYRRHHGRRAPFPLLGHPVPANRPVRSAQDHTDSGRLRDGSVWASHARVIPGMRWRLILGSTAQGTRVVMKFGVPSAA